MGSTAKRDTKGLERAERDAKAAEMRKCGATLKQIADELGYASPSNVARAIKKLIADIPKAASEDLREKLQADLREAYKAAHSLIHDRDKRTRLRAVDTVVRTIKGQYEVAGMKPPLVTINTAPPETRFDLSVFTPAELEVMRAIKTIGASAAEGCERPSNEYLADIARGWLSEVATPAPLRALAAHAEDGGTVMARAEVVDDDDF